MSMTHNPPDARPAPTGLGPVVKTEGGIYFVKQLATVGETYKIECPVCKGMFTAAPTQKGTRKVRCPHCQTPIFFKAKDNRQAETYDDNLPMPTDHVIMSPTLLNHPGRLVWGFLGTKSRQLTVGRHIIGRKDSEARSDIEFDDDYMSRQSVAIDVAKDPNYSGYSFKLTVLRATNPVIVGDQVMHEGDSLNLNYDDTIRMGKTVLTFKENKNK